MSYKISILMPTYNDELYIQKSIKSIIEQTYKNWELIVINDGSTDSTENKIREFKNGEIKYIYQENSDQLNALQNGSTLITGDIVMLLHSDDLLNNANSLVDIIKEFENNPNIDGLYADLITIDASSSVTGTIKTAEFKKNDLLKRIFWTRGSNLIGDIFAVKKVVYDKNIIPNYIRDNTIYYLATPLLNLKKVDSWYKYRVFNENYINSDVGKFVVYNGTQRTIYKHFFEKTFSLYPLILNPFIHKVINRFGLHKMYKLKSEINSNWPFLKKYYSLWLSDMVSQEHSDLAKKQLTKTIDSINKRMSSKKNNCLEIKYSQEQHYFGKDARNFYKDYKSAQLNLFYKKILEENYNYILVHDMESKKAVEVAINFYGFYYEVVYE